MAKVDVNISDLFFNTEHTFGDGEYPDLQQEAEGFLQNLDNLGVPTPTPEDLIRNFKERL